MRYFFADAGKPLLSRPTHPYSTVLTASWIGFALYFAAIFQDPANAQCLQFDYQIEAPSDLIKSEDWPLEFVRRSNPLDRFRLAGLLPEHLPNTKLREKQQMLIEAELAKSPDLHFIFLSKSNKQDRYGRKRVFLLGKREDQSPQSSISLQEKLLNQGLARLEPSHLTHRCASKLQNVESKARRDRKGLWIDPDLGVKQTWDVHVPAMISTYQIVHGKVLSVSRRPTGTSYLNFGRNWKTDFTAKLSKKTLAMWEQQNNSLDDLHGTSIYVRGWIESHNGPLIRISSPHQLQIDVGDTKRDEQSLEQ